MKTPTEESDRSRMTGSIGASATLVPLPGGMLYAMSSSIAAGDGAKPTGGGTASR
jgi:hypothetical protein